MCRMGGRIEKYGKTNKSGGSDSLLRNGVGALSRPRSISNRIASRRAGPSGEVRPDERRSRCSRESRSESTAFPEELPCEDEEESSRLAEPSRTDGNADSLTSPIGPMSAGGGVVPFPCPFCRRRSSASDAHSIPSLSLPTSSSQAAPTSSQFLSWPWERGCSFLTRPGSIGGAGSVQRDVQTMDTKNMCDFKALGSLGLPRGPAPRRSRGSCTWKITLAEKPIRFKVYLPATFAPSPWPGRQSRSEIHTLLS